MFLVVGVRNPGLAGELALPGILAGFPPGWQGVYWGSRKEEFSFEHISVYQSLVF